MKKQLLSISIALASFAASAQTIFVAADAVGLNTGNDWVNAYTNLQNAINNAQPGQEIWVKTGTYTPSIDETGNLPADTTDWSFWMKNGVSILGGFNGTELLVEQRDPYTNKATLDGQISSTKRAKHVINAESGVVDTTAILDGFIVQNGLSNTHGGGAYLVQCSPTFVNVNFLNNAANQHGGGVHSHYSNSVFVNCRFEGNFTYQYDGGAANFQYSNIEMYNCVFFDNHANRFGGIFTSVSANVTVQNATMASNTAGNNLFQASNIGGGPWLVEINQSILWDNSAPNVVGTQAGNGVDFEECLSQYAGNYIVSDPLFTDLANGDLTLTDQSPAIDTLAMNPENEYTDPSGGFRIVGASTDLGAYEYQSLSTGVKEVATNNVVVSPNPASNFITVNAAEKINTIQIYSITGELVNNYNNQRIDVSEFTAGVYFMVVQGTNLNKTIKFIKE